MELTISHIPLNPCTMEGAEESILPGEILDGEMPEAQSFLPTPSGKQFVCVPKNSTPFSQKLADQVKDLPQPKEPKSFDSKGELRTRSYKEIPKMRTKTFTPLQKNNVVKTDSQTAPKFTKVLVKTRKTSQKNFKSPTSETSKNFSTKRSSVIPQKIVSRTTVSAKKESDVRKQEKTREKQQKQESSFLQSHEKQEERLEEKNREGFHEHNEREKQEEEPIQENEKVSAIEKKEEIYKEFLTYGSSESTLLSELFQMRVSQFDVFVLFIEVMKLSLKGREQERISRREERMLQLDHMQKIVDNFKQQGQNMLMTSLASGFMGIASGALPIIGHMKGEWILDKFSNVFSSLKDMKPDRFFKQIAKMTHMGSEMSKSTGQIHNTFAEGQRTYNQQMSDIHKTDWEEDTRTMEELKDQWKNIENFLHQSMQMHHDVIRQLYS